MFFLWPTNILLYGQTTFCLFISQLKEICAISIWGPSWITSWSFLYKFLCGHVLSSLEYIFRSRILESNGNCTFNIVKKFWSFFQSIVPLYFLFKRVRVLIIQCLISTRYLTLIIAIKVVWSGKLLWFEFVFPSELTEAKDIKRR